MELVNQLVEQLGITQDQAKGGIGALFSVAKEQLGTEKFSQLTDAIPELAGMETCAPQGGALSSVGSLAGALGGGLGKLGQIGRLGEMFSRLDLNSDMLGSFVPLVLSFVKSKGGETVKQLLASVLK